MVLLDDLIFSRSECLTILNDNVRFVKVSHRSASIGVNVAVRSHDSTRRLVLVPPDDEGDSNHTHNTDDHKNDGSDTSRTDLVAVGGRCFLLSSSSELFAKTTFV